MQKIKTTSRCASDYVRKRKPFTNSNDQLYGEWVTPDTYAVFSYGPHWPLYICRKNVWFANSDKRSVTTTRHSSYAYPQKRTFGRSCQWMRDAVKNARKEQE